MAFQGTLLPATVTYLKQSKSSILDAEDDSWMNWQSIYYDKSSGVEKEELERKLAAYSHFASRLRETLSTVKELLFVVAILLLLIQHTLSIFSVEIPNQRLSTPIPGPFLTSIVLLITTVGLLALAILLLWYYAGRRARIEEVVNIISASKRYERTISQIQKEILKTLRQGAKDNEQPT